MGFKMFCRIYKFSLFTIFLNVLLSNLSIASDSQIIEEQNVAFSKSLYQDIVVQGQQDLIFIQEELYSAQSNLQSTQDRMEHFPDNTRLQKKLLTEKFNVARLQGRLDNLNGKLWQQYKNQCLSDNVPILFTEQNKIESYLWKLITHHNGSEKNEIKTTVFDLPDEIIIDILELSDPKGAFYLTFTCNKLYGFKEDIAVKTTYKLFGIDINDVIFDDHIDQSKWHGDLKVKSEEFPFSHCLSWGTNKGYIEKCMQDDPVHFLNDLRKKAHNWYLSALISENHKFKISQLFSAGLAGHNLARTDLARILKWKIFNNHEDAIIFPDNFYFYVEDIRQIAELRAHMEDFRKSFMEQFSISLRNIIPMPSLTCLPVMLEPIELNFVIDYESYLIPVSEEIQDNNDV
jgi:hypothetical protein